MNQIISLRTRFAQASELPFNDILGRNELFQIIQEETRTFRNRIYPPVVTLTAFLLQVLSTDHSCQETVSRVIAERLTQGQDGCSSNTGPYCKARQRLSKELMTRLILHTGQKLHEATIKRWNWKGRCVKLVDGTTLAMPDTPKNQKVYPQSRAQKPGLGFPQIRLVAMLSMSSGALLNYATGPSRGKNTGEHTLLRRILDSLAPSDVLVADRYYGSYFLIAELLRRGVDGLFRFHSNRKISQRTKDHLVVWSKPQRPRWMNKVTYQSIPEQITLRQTKIKGKIFISSFLNFKKVTRLELKELYTQRWLIELDLSLDQNGT